TPHPHLFSILTFSSRIPCPPRSTLFPYTTLFRSLAIGDGARRRRALRGAGRAGAPRARLRTGDAHDIARRRRARRTLPGVVGCRSEEHTSELQSRFDLVCRLLLEKKNYSLNKNKN